MSAKRFGGAFSPGGASEDQTPAPDRFEGRKAAKVDIGALCLFFAPLPLLFSGIGEIRRGDALAMTTELGAFVLIVLAAWLLRAGIEAQAEYDARKAARRPAMPRKIFAAGLTGLGVLLAVWFGWGLGPVSGAIFGAVAGAALLFAWGPDPLSDKGFSGLDKVAVSAAAEAIEKAQGVVDETLAAAAEIGDRALERRIDGLAAAARDVFAQIEEDPRDLRRARKFMSVYLAGARDATVKFAATWTKTRDPGVRAQYEALLGDLETSFTKQREILLMDDKVDLEVEIEVLQDRLKQEGLG